MVTWLGLTGYERNCSMGNSSIVLGTNSSINQMNTLTSLLFCNETYNACTIVNLQDLQDSLFSVPCTNLLQYITKIYSTNLLLNSSSVLRQNCIRRLMVLKEVTIDLRLYICVYVRVCTMDTLYEKSLFTIAYLQMFVKSNIVLGIH